MTFGDCCIDQFEKGGDSAVLIGPKRAAPLQHEADLGGVGRYCRHGLYPLPRATIIAATGGQIGGKRLLIVRHER